MGWDGIGRYMAAADDAKYRNGKGIGMGKW